jgi:hypothetical protein
VVMPAGFDLDAVRNGIDHSVEALSALGAAR